MSEEEQEAERDRAFAWLQAKWLAPAKQCPICLANAWTVSEVVEVRPFSGGGLVIGGTVFPVFMLICNNCGYSLMFNAVISGVVKPPESGTDEGQAASMPSPAGEES